MKPIPPHPALAILLRHRIRRRRLRHRLVKHRVKARIVPHVRKPSPSSPRITAIAAGSCSGANSTASSRSFITSSRNPHMPVQLRPRMHHPIPHRIHLRQPCPAHRIHHQPNRLHRGLGLHLAPSPTQIPPRRIAKLEPSPSPRRSPSPHPQTATAAHPLLHRTRENLIDEDPLLITSICTPPPLRSDQTTVFSS